MQTRGLATKLHGTPVLLWNLHKVRERVVLHRLHRPHRVSTHGARGAGSASAHQAAGSPFCVPPRHVCSHPQKHLERNLRARLASEWTASSYARRGRSAPSQPPLLRRGSRRSVPARAPRVSGSPSPVKDAARTEPVLAKYSSTRRMPILYPLDKKQGASAPLPAQLANAAEPGAQFVQLRVHILDALLAVVHKLRGASRVERASTAREGFAPRKQ